MDVLVSLVSGVECKRLRAKPTKALFVYKYFQWIHTCNEHVYAQIKLVPIQ